MLKMPDPPLRFYRVLPFQEFVDTVQSPDQDTNLFLLYALIVRLAAYSIQRTDDQKSAMVLQR